MCTPLSNPYSFIFPRTPLPLPIIALTHTHSHVYRDCVLVCEGETEEFGHLKLLQSIESFVGIKGDNQSAEITQIDTKSEESSNSISKDEWLTSIKNYDDDTTDKFQIQRIPSLLREIESNKKCYDPLVVSIGPYHHGKPQLQAFEDLKIPVTKKFVRHCGNQVSIEQLYEEVAKVGDRARKCYKKGSTKEYDDESFNKMMFLDACFVLSFPETEVDPLQPWSCFLVFACRDLFLLENQIPLLVLKVLMKFRFKNESKRTELIQNLIDHAIIIPTQEKEEWKIDMDAPHLLHLVWEQLIGSSSEDKEEKKSVRLCLGWEQLIGSSPENKNMEESVKLFSYRSATELKSTGIHFRPSQTNHVTDVKFKSHLISGTLTLPSIMVDHSTKSLLLNLTAYEMCPHGPSDHGIMSYISLMDSLIDHADDVKELRRRRILVNNLGSDEELAQLFNEIANDLLIDPDAYADVKLQIKNHCESHARVWMAEWIHDHFSSPWAFLAFLGAIFVIVLTAVQTIFAVFLR